MISSGSQDGTIQIWSMSTGQTKHIINTNSNVYSLKLLTNGYYLACGLGYPSFSINIYDLNDEGRLLNSLQGHENSVNDLAVLSDDLLASSSQDFTVRIWNLTTNTTKFILRGHVNIVTSLKLISIETLASASYDTTIKLWNITDGTLIRTLLGHKNLIENSLDILNDGQTTLVSGSKDQTIKLWDWTTGQCLNTIETDDWIVSLIYLNTTTTSTTSFTSVYSTKPTLGESLRILKLILYPKQRF